MVPGCGYSAEISIPGTKRKPLGFTGIDAPYETPSNPEIHLKSQEHSVSQAVEIIFNYLRRHGRLVQQG